MAAWERTANKFPFPIILVASIAVIEKNFFSKQQIIVSNFNFLTGVITKSVTILIEKRNQRLKVDILL